MNLSPRRISAWFRGRNRQSTLMLHSLLVSAMVVAGDGLGTSRAAGAVCAPEEGCSAGAEAEDRCSRSGSRWGARAKAGEQGRGALARSCGTGMRATWASGPLSALCLSAPRAAAPRCGPGRGGGRGAGGASFAGGPPLGVHPRGRLSVLLASSPPLTLPGNLALTPSPPESLAASHLPTSSACLSPPSGSTPLERIRGLRWACPREESRQRFHPFYSGTSSSPTPAPPLSPSSAN